MIKEIREPLLSVLVPVYKAEEYLKDCIESILAQTVNDLELILVNDGSPDKSGAICDEYALKDKRIRVIHKKNGGASSARNAAVKAARGKYIGWVDADDRIDPKMYETLISLLESYNADIAECNYYEVSGIKSIKKNRDEPIIHGSGNFILKQFFSSYMKPHLWNKIYKREIWDGVRFPLGRNHQDFYVNVRFALLPLTYVRTSKAYYYYIIRENSITTTRTGRELRETVYKYDYTMDLATDYSDNIPARRYLKKDAVNRLMGRFFEVTVNSHLKNQYVYTYIIRKKLGFSLVKYLLTRRLPLKTRISYLLIISNLKELQKFFHKYLGTK